MEKEKKKYHIGSEHYTLYEKVEQGVSVSLHRAFCKPLKEIVTIKILDCDLEIFSLAHTVPSSLETSVFLLAFLIQVIGSV
ncbi:hypothetical protein TB1_046042 [Malus domestica]